MTGEEIVLLIALFITILAYLGSLEWEKKKYYEDTGQRCREYMNQIDSLMDMAKDCAVLGIGLVIISFIICVVIGFINNFLDYELVDTILVVVFTFSLYFLLINVLYMCVIGIVFVGIFSRIINKIRIKVDDKKTKYNDNSFVVNFARRTIILLTAGILIFVAVHISLPGVRGLYSISDEFDKGCLETLRQNGNIQAGNKAFVYFGNYYKDSINIKSKNDKLYKPAKMEDVSSDFYSSNVLFGGKLPDFVNVDNMIFGVEDDNIYISDINHKEYKNIKADWKSSVTDENGKYDYDKAKKIIDKQYQSGISAIEVAGIVGLMKEKVLIGFDKENMVFMEQNGTDIKFVHLNKNEKKMYGPYNVNLFRSVFYVNNKIWFVDSIGKVKYCNTTNGELVNLDNYQPVNELAYYLDKDEDGNEFAWLVVSANEGGKNRISKFKDSSAEKWDNVGDIDDGKVASLYVSKRGAVAIMENGDHAEVKFSGFKKYGYISQNMKYYFFDSIDVVKQTVSYTKKTLGYMVLPFRKLKYLVE